MRVKTYCLKKPIFYYTHLETDFMSRVISILSDDAQRLLQIAFLRLLRPPVHQVTLFVELSALVIKTMGDLVTDYEPNGAVVHVPRTIAGEERALQDTSGELWKMYNRVYCSNYMVLMIPIYFMCAIILCIGIVIQINVIVFFKKNITFNII